MASTAEIAQPQRRSCGTMAHFNRLAELDPDYRARLADIEGLTVLRMARMALTRQTRLTVPVVVHIIHRIAAENISDEQVHSQIEVLNADYSATNADKAMVPSPWQSLAADAQIRFALASIGPDGAATGGIVRVKTRVDEFGQDEAVKFSATGGSDAWDIDRYLNIWVCNLGDGLLGYAQFPGGPKETDGVVIRYTAFGTTGTAAAPFDKGRTTTHEVAHFLNLRHIWGDTEDCSGTDHVSDTPRQQLPNYDKPSFPHVSCNNGPNGDMFMNYMDYVDDDAMFMFTHGQVARMRATLTGQRKGLVRTGVARRR